MFHRTERLFLRPAWPEDWQAVLGGIADEGVVKNLARVPWPYAARDAQVFVARAQDPRHPSFLIVEAASGRAVGCVGIGGKADPSRAPELGYWLARPFWGRGYARKGAQAALAYARETLRRSDIISVVRPANAASIRVAEALGAVRAGGIEFFGGPALIYRYPHVQSGRREGRLDYR